MVYKCSVVNCTGNYDKERQCKVYRLPKNEAEKQDWVNKIPSFRPCLNYRVCEKHWPKDAPMTKVTGGSRPAVPPTIFNVPTSCLPTPKPPKDFIYFILSSSDDLVNLLI